MQISTYLKIVLVLIPIVVTLLVRIFTCYHDMKENNLKDRKSYLIELLAYSFSLCGCFSFFCGGISYIWNTFSFWIYVVFSFIIMGVTIVNIFIILFINLQGKKEDKNRGVPVSEKEDKNRGVPVSEAVKQKKNINNALVRVTMSPAEYKELILDAESDASEIFLVPKRMTVMFKSERMIREMAKERFGDGNSYAEDYISEHMNRKAAFYDRLNQGCKVYEIHNINELTNYINKPDKHAGIKSIKNKYIIEMLQLWKEAIEKYNNYHVALTDEAVPIKYELINQHKFIMHESAGKNVNERLNSFFIDSYEIGCKAHKDFLDMWNRTDNVYRDKVKIIEWINAMISNISVN